jgi:DNA ligase-1
MDLTKFTKKNLDEEKLILNNDDIKVIQKGDYIEFELKTKEALEKYEKYFFLSTTHKTICDDVNSAKYFFEEAMKAKVEGIMMKNINSSYRPGLRTGAMTKIKETKENLDVVILAAELGKGKRTGYYSSFLVGVLNPYFNSEDEKFLIVGKVASGIKENDSESDISMQNLTKILEKYKIKEEEGFVWFEPRVVIEIKYQEIQKSSKYNSGYALRFPRIVNLRDDKTVDEINTIDDIEKFL